MGKKILGLDLGSNSIGWALLGEKNGKPAEIINLGSRIFTKAVEEKIPTPKNVKRRNARLARRIIQRRARRKLRMLNYLIMLRLLPRELAGHAAPEIILNELGNPYFLRAKALDNSLTPFELGRVFLHLVQRRGFLSNRKTLLGDMADDPDVLDVLTELEGKNDNSSERAKEETAFKAAISQLKNTIAELGFRTVGEYLASLDHHDCKRNRSRDGGHLRTDRQMYRDELDLIWEQQKQHHAALTDDVKEQLEEIIFKQRPLKLNSDRRGKCSLEPARKRARIARLESQRFRYLQDINNLQYFDYYTEKSVSLNEPAKQKLVQLFETTADVSFAGIRKNLGFDKTLEFNLENGNKKLKGNITACEIRKQLPEWDLFDDAKQHALVEDLLTITKKSVLKNRLMNHWAFSANTAVQLCLLEFEPGHSNHSIKAINKLLPFLQQGRIYSDARVSAGYGYEVTNIIANDRLGIPPQLPNPIVQKALHELRRLINAIIAEYGKPDAIRVEMARDLEMNTKRYQEFITQQAKNAKANDEAVSKYQEMAQKNPQLALSKYPAKTDKLKYRLWQDQNYCCAYSGKSISLATLFSAEIDIDHILPYSASLDDSFMNKVVCFAGENRFKGQKTPVDAFGGNTDKWNQITQAISRWHKSLKSKKARFFTTAAELQKRDFISTQLNDTRYISKIAQTYLAELGADISVSKGITTAWLRHQWGLNSLIGETDKKERTDHRHHAIDAVVIACVDRRLYQDLVNTAHDLERKQSELNMKDIHIDPPWLNLREDCQQALNNVIIAHTPQRKLIGELHEVTGAGFIDGVGNVNRKNLDGNFTQVNKIIDPDVKTLVEEHLRIYSNNPKTAFAEGVTVFHKDGKTPIKRVRIVQSKTTLAKLENTKFGAKDKQGKVFKWLAFGNLHHVEIIRHNKTGSYSGQFVTMMEASHRAKGIKMNRQPIIKKDHGEDYEFIMALHINDLISIEKDGQRVFYRIQKLDSGGNRIMIRLNTTTVLDHKSEEIYFSINENSFTTWQFQKHSINAIGKLIE
ncbi:CRISPR-associated endonuclease Cas9 [Candidatus Methylobacter favarea]|uniref:CRISPR-associated endonuclease Cas9 n=1 Tax=Candidatus Methylobacter favarea TaxID=2707345 RepID=A0A8S0XQ55_9GAMM|nr:type II CRISPR RNA-guided endonuclease Cas9 [Candidatus Methylobacter favarea]CAA9888985.1 CRISPR-associated endonuclease Cas9 [Candidatus Methylobacter favarea]